MSFHDSMIKHLILLFLVVFYIIPLKSLSDPTVWTPFGYFPEECVIIANQSNATVANITKFENFSFNGTINATGYFITYSDGTLDYYDYVPECNEYVQDNNNSSNGTDTWTYICEDCCDNETIMVSTTTDDTSSTTNAAEEPLTTMIFVPPIQDCPPPPYIMNDKDGEPSIEAKKTFSGQDIDGLGGFTGTLLIPKDKLNLHCQILEYSISLTSRNKLVKPEQNFIIKSVVAFCGDLKGCGQSFPAGKTGWMMNVFIIDNGMIQVDATQWKFLPEVQNKFQQNSVSITIEVDGNSIKSNMNHEFLDFGLLMKDPDYKPKMQTSKSPEFNFPAGSNRKFLEAKMSGLFQKVDDCPDVNKNPLRFQTLALYDTKNKNQLPKDWVAKPEGHTGKTACLGYFDWHSIEIQRPQGNQNLKKIKKKRIVYTSATIYGRT